MLESSLPGVRGRVPQDAIDVVFWAERVDSVRAELSCLADLSMNDRDLPQGWTDLLRDFETTLDQSIRRLKKVAQGLCREVS